MSDLNQELIPSEARHHRLSLGRIGRRLALLLTFCAILIFQGAWPSLAERPQLIRVGIFQNRPIVFQDEHGLPQGLYVDLLRKIAQEEDWEIEFVPGSWVEGLKRLRTGEIDLMTSIAYTRERDKHMDFSSENVLMMWGQVYVKPDSGVQNILDLKGQKVAILKDGINGINFRKLCRDFEVNCQFVIVDSYTQVFDLVARGKVGSGVVNNVHGDILAREYGVRRTPIFFSPFSLLFAAPERKHRELLSAIDNRLAAWKRNASSFYYETLDNWFGGDATRKYRIPRWAIFTLVISGGLLLFFLIFAYMLNAQVKGRTREAMLAAKMAQESERYNRTLFEDSPIGLALCRMDGTLVDVNPAYANIMGRNVAETMKLTYWGITPGKYSEQEAVQLESLETAGRYGPYEKEYIHKDGRLVPVRLSGMILEKDGEPFILSSVENISERKRAEESLRKSEAKVRLMVLEIKDYAILMLDPDGKVASWNEGAQHIKGYTSEEIMGEHFSRFYTQEDAGRGKPKKELEAAATQGRFEDEGWRVRKDGSQFWANVIITALRDDTGVLAGFSNITRDITERKQAEEELEKHRQHLEEMVRERTTELQTIVNSMAGREVRMAELKETIRKLHAQIESAGLTPVADDPLKEAGRETLD